ncbi:uncharacterized protein LOC18445808 isoform X3 [Amborella trichopoda]|uniref:uncharacterized protein LOC18445808 isoform X3 n=1 Tax=Amborella trichopoda TaxID=13333 RepID=UPI0009BE52C7|nr:uncharacterized protein LOC18445808 isoform X3 [Amborella trichopoda]|eukprot:XP_020530161.1 uncharacterized protein LOC18445808 isoform X3 [Amborella trichopoda]
MADLASYGAERDIEQAVTALKKGTHLIKYGRKGKPKFCPFRLSADETSLVWYSHGEERHLKLETVSKIIPGQRTAVFRRYLRPEKDYLSFSLLYNNGERTLDLICKDQVETDVWVTGLKALISTGQRRRNKTDAHSEGLYSDEGGDLNQNSPIHRAFGATLGINSSSTHRNLNTKAIIDFYSREPSFTAARSDVGTDRSNMLLRGGTGDNLRHSVSSAPSSSSQGSGPDDIESLGDVYVWGEVWCDGSLKNGVDGAPNSGCSKADVLLPKPLECNVVLDVHHIACGVRHAALVTRQGEVFTWGEESGGRLGHGIDADSSQPQLVESLALCNADFVACGEYHTCAVTVTGELYTWGDGTHNAGLLGHGNDVSHWIPKRVFGPLEGLQVTSVACGPWHSALATSTGQLFTFGDGTFGVLGHGERESVAYPREVESLKGLKTSKVACGVWHTAAIVEVIVAQSGANVLSRKLFTWGDGDKNRLGQGDKDPRLVPTCVPSLIEYNFHQLACGHDLTIGLTTSGHVFTMGSTVYGQLGNPQSDGKLPCLVQDRLVGELVEEIACGSYHVAVLTSRSELFTWGKGANGRLGHGDVEDRKTPTLVEALKDRHVKSITCGSNFTATICLHKWVSGTDQSLCTGCRQAFGFTRKRHNCYNCGLVHCHACSSKKALRAALAPNPGKPHRVCDTCYSKLKKASEASSSFSVDRKTNIFRRSIDQKDRTDRGEVKSSKIILPRSFEPAKSLEVKSIKSGKKPDSLSLIRTSPIPSLLQLKDLSFSIGVNSPVAKSTASPIQQPVIIPRSASPLRRPSPPRSVTPFPTIGGLSASKNTAEGLKKKNELLNQEVSKLQAQVKTLKLQIEVRDEKMQKSVREAQALAAEETTKCNAAKEVIKSLISQLKDLAEKLPPGIYDTSNLCTLMDLPNGDILGGNHEPATPDAIHGESSEGRPSVDSSSPMAVDSIELYQQNLIDNPMENNEERNENQHLDDNQDQKMDESSEIVTNDTDPIPPNGGEGEIASSATPADSEDKETEAQGSKVKDSTQKTEQFEPGVYITFVLSEDGTKIFKRVRFSYAARKGLQRGRQRSGGQLTITGCLRSIKHANADEV